MQTGSVISRARRWAARNPIELVLSAGVACVALALILGNSGSHPLTGEVAPRVTLTSLSGEPVDTASHLGREVVVLDFFATWCGPCRVSLPQIAEIAEAYGDRIAVYAVNVREDPETVEAFLKQSKLQLNVLLDEDGGVAEDFRVRGIPQSVVIDTDGNVTTVLLGAGIETALRRAIDAALRRAPSAAPA